MLHWTDDVSDPQHAVSSDALRRLESFTDARGRRLKVLVRRPEKGRKEGYSLIEKGGGGDSGKGISLACFSF